MNVLAWVAGVLCAWFAVACICAPFIGRLLRRRAAAAVTEAEAQAMAQANAGHCPVCSRHPGNGPCTCISVCGHPDCVGDHTSMAGLTAADVRWLRKVSIKGDE